MSIRIVFKGFVDETTSAEGVAILAKVFNGDRAQAEEAMITRDYVLRTVNSKAEIGLILPRLERLGIRCEVVEGDQVAAGAFNDFEVVTRTVTCKFCGYQQPMTKTCRKCGQLVNAVRKIDWKPAVEIAPKDDVVEDEYEDVAAPSAFVDWLYQWRLFSFRSMVVVFLILGILVWQGVLDVPGQSLNKELATLPHQSRGAENFPASQTGAMPDREGGPNATASTGTSANKPGNPIAMLLKGIVTSDPDEVAKTMTYDPESGENPYARRLESLGIDQQEFSRAAAGIDGPITMGQVQEEIDKNKLLKDAIDSTLSKSIKSTGDTETDQLIQTIDNEVR